MLLMLELSPSLADTRLIMEKFHLGIGIPTDTKAKLSLFFTVFIILTVTDRLTIPSSKETT